MKYFARVNVMLRDGLLDTQGQTLKSVLNRKGYLFIEEIKVGKHIVLLVEADDTHDAQQKVREICEKILHNPVIEKYEFTIAPVTSHTNKQIEQ